MINFVKAISITCETCGAQVYDSFRSESTPEEIETTCAVMVCCFNCGMEHKVIFIDGFSIVCDKDGHQRADKVRCSMQEIESVAVVWSDYNECLDVPGLEYEPIVSVVRVPMFDEFYKYEGYEVLYISHDNGAVDINRIIGKYGCRFWAGVPSYEEYNHVMYRRIANAIGVANLLPAIIKGSGMKTVASASSAIEGLISSGDRKLLGFSDDNILVKKDLVTSLIRKLGISKITTNDIIGVVKAAMILFSEG